MLRLGRFSEAIDVLYPLDLNADALSLASAAGVLALAWLRQGQFDRALTLVEERAEQVLKVPLGATVLDGYTGMAEVFLESWLLARARNDSAAARWRHFAQRFCEALERAARAHAIVRPAARCFRGRWWLAHGRRSAARRSFERALHAARELGMPFEAAMSQRLLVQLGQADHEG